MNVNEIINHPRISNADYHAAIGKSWQEIGVKKYIPAPLSYSAFEYRLAIERIVFELYYFMHNDGMLKSKIFTKEQLSKLEQFSSLVKVMTEEVGNKLKIFRLLTFNKIFIEIFINFPKPLCIPDIGKLKKYWQMLSNYCHQKFKPEETWQSKNWVMQGYKEIKQVEMYLKKIMVDEAFGWPDRNTLDIEILELRDEYVNNKEFADSQLETRLKLMKPVIESRSGIPILIKPII